ncbi:TetR/AcrR family transcriptional regulator [Actinosynnema pretiosum subsp. pretiosum]|uniref:Regulatory protein TetR n=3 Tax=Actinosynnema TaxID=40566 RepID=C6WI42_ACTMD|nr:MULTISPECIES: TetR/AcrR family transcriptional regulator [Actinosynnema]ACU34493.1 regulatory protein TetR [Actinosynnema mirum DSM 43827]ATE52331.1 TetR/AcrR family transcriptional regulator [Actinosynnema pretiosum]AXX27863.1 Transcriptional regulator, TetR family [Actinosynnema pretiosum subsp. pretiosum]QUF01450.1 TetR/AcrR family transcriptional regulator [Actinosynnema pretiosum subsp. pretiosum]
MTSIVGRPLTPRQVDLLGKLESLVLAEGFAHFTLDDLAARLHCSKSTLYALAASKEQLAVRVVRRYFKGAAEHIERRVADLKDAPAKVGTYLAVAAEELRRASARFLADVADYAPTRSTYERNARAAAARLREFIQEGVRDGVFRDVQAVLIAEMAGVLIENIQTGVLPRRAGVTDAEAFTALGELLLDGLRRERSQG